MKRVRIDTKNYYKVQQLQSVVNRFHDDHEGGSLCIGCAFFRNGIQTAGCPDDREGVLRCCEKDIDWIFIPATKQGLAAFVAHRLEHS